jgi:hypothetical protein
MTNSDKCFFDTVRRISANIQRPLPELSMLRLFFEAGRRSTKSIKRKEREYEHDDDSED